MYGLPGQEFDEIREGVEFLKSLDVKINLTEFSPGPGNTVLGRSHFQWDNHRRHRPAADKQFCLFPSFFRI